MKVLLFILTSLLFVCAVSPAAGAGETPVRIGVVLPLTGEFGTWGQRIKQGLMLAAEDTNHRFDFRFQDEGNCDAKLAVSGAVALLNIEKTKILFMGCLAGTKAAGPLAAKAGALMLSTGLLDEEVLRQKLPLINLATDFVTEAKILAAHVAKEGVRKAALLRWPDAFGEEFARAVVAELKERGVEIIADEFSVTMNADFRSFILRMQQAQADAVITNLGDAQILALAKQAKENKASFRIFSNYVIETNSIPSSDLDGIEYTYPVNHAEGSESKRKFDERFAARFGGTPSANSYFAHDGLIALDNALERCPASDTHCIFSEIISRPANGIAGEVSFMSGGRSVRPYGIKKVESGKFVWKQK